MAASEGNGVVVEENITKVSKYLGLDNIPKDHTQKISTDSHGSLAGFGSLVLKLGKQQAESTKVPYLGSNSVEEALVRQWIEYGVCAANYCDSAMIAQRVFKELNVHLSSQTYLIGNKCTLADAVLYHLLHNAVKSLSFQEKEQYIHLSRWFNNLQQDARLRGSSSPIYFSRTPLY